MHPTYRISDYWREIQTTSLCQYIPSAIDCVCHHMWNWIHWRREGKKRGFESNLSLLNENIDLLIICELKKWHFERNFGTNARNYDSFLALYDFVREICYIKRQRQYSVLNFKPPPGLWKKVTQNTAANCTLFIRW